MISRNDYAAMAAMTTDELDSQEWAWAAEDYAIEVIRCAHSPRTFVLVINGKSYRAYWGGGWRVRWTDENETKRRCYGIGPRDCAAFMVQHLRPTTKLG